MLSFQSNKRRRTTLSKRVKPLKILFRKIIIINDDKQSMFQTMACLVVMGYLFLGEFLGSKFKRTKANALALKQFGHQTGGHLQSLKINNSSHL